MFTHTPGYAFAALGRHGPILLVLSLISGTTVPPLATIAHSILPIAAFLLTLGSFLTAGLAPRENAVGLRLTAATVVWAGVGVPFLVACGLLLVHVGTDTRSGVLLSVLAPFLQCYGQGPSNRCQQECNQLAPQKGHCSCRCPADIATSLTQAFAASMAARSLHGPNRKL